MKTIKILFALTLTTLSACSQKNHEQTETKVENKIEEPILEEQKFEIDASKANQIVGKQGLIFHIPSHAFLDENGNQVTGKVQIVLKEVLTMTDFLHANVHTISDGKLLSTGGSFYFMPKVGDKELKINPNVGIIGNFPVPKMAEGYEMFKGEKTADGNINWKPIPSKQVKLPENPNNTEEIKKPEPPKGFVETPLADCMRLLQAIEANYVKKGKLWELKVADDVNTPVRSSFVDSLKNWIKYLQNPQMTSKIQKENQKIQEAWNNYNEALKKYENYQFKKHINKSSEMQRINFMFNQTGWANCDKFIGGLQEYTLSISEPVKEQIIHVIGEGVHLSFLYETKIKFNFGKNIPFSVILFSPNDKNKYFEQVFLGDQQELTFNTKELQEQIVVN